MFRPIRDSLLVPLLLMVSACDPHTPQEGDPSQAQTTAYDIPQKRDDGWDVAALAAADIDETPFVEMQAHIEAGDYTGISSILIARRGTLVFERYFGDQERDDLHTMRSASKVLTSMLVGIAIEKGFIPSADQKVLPYFPEYEGHIANWDDRKHDITIEHLMTMTSGVRNNEDAMYESGDWIKFYLDQPLAAAPGDAFSYATSGAVILGNIITRASGLRVPAFTDTYLFSPMNINAYRWPYTSSLGDQHLAMTGGGLNLKSRDMLKLGQLFLNGGEWAGQQLISPAWIEESTSKHATSDLYGEDYGYFWRMLDRRRGEGQTVRSYEAWGNGGQFVMVFPTLDLVAVFTGENYGLFPEMEQPFVLMEKYILPAVK